MSAHSSEFKLSEWIFTTDHKRIGVMYLIGSIAAFAVAGVMAILIRIEQSSLGPTLASDPLLAGDQYNQWLYFHGAAMILGFLIPGLTGFAANYFLPLMIGARDVAFPRINALLGRDHRCAVGVLHPRFTGYHVDRLPAVLTGYGRQHGLLRLHRPPFGFRLNPWSRQLSGDRDLHAGSRHGLEPVEHVRLVHGHRFRHPAGFRPGSGRSGNHALV